MKSFLCFKNEVIWICRFHAQVFLLNPDPDIWPPERPPRGVSDPLEDLLEGPMTHNHLPTLTAGLVTSFMPPCGVTDRLSLLQTGSLTYLSSPWGQWPPAAGSVTSSRGVSDLQPRGQWPPRLASSLTWSWSPRGSTRRTCLRLGSHSM